MEKVFVDTNIVIDLLAKREPFFREAQELFTLADKKEIRVLISSLTFANAFYSISKHYKNFETKNHLQKFKILVEILPLDEKVIELTLSSDFADFEDGLQYFVALNNGADIIITRNKKDFKTATIPVLSADEYLKR